MARHNELGSLGEGAVANHLRRKGYRLIESNYRKKWGEIDLIMQRGNTVHFVEVKTVSRVTGKVRGNDAWRAEENVHPLKLRKLMRTIETWLAEREYDGEWQFDVAAVYIDSERRRGSIRMIENADLA